MSFRSTLILIILLFSGCLPLDDQPKFKIYNKSGILYDRMIVHSNQEVASFDSFNTGDIVKGRFVFDQNIKTDGSYGISLFQGDSLVRSIDWGYYTNGASLDCCFRIYIHSDTAIITESRMF